MSEDWSCTSWPSRWRNPDRRNQAKPGQDCKRLRGLTDFDINRTAPGRGGSLRHLRAGAGYHRSAVNRIVSSEQHHPVPKYRIIKITRIVIEIASELVEAACRQSRIARSCGSAGAPQSGA
jgi:hypothetical protein